MKLYTRVTNRSCNGNGTRGAGSELATADSPSPRQSEGEPSASPDPIPLVQTLRLAAVAPHATKADMGMRWQGRKRRAVAMAEIGLWPYGIQSPQGCGLRKAAREDLTFDDPGQMPALFDLHKNISVRECGAGAQPPSLDDNTEASDKGGRSQSESCLERHAADPVLTIPPRTRSTPGQFEPHATRIRVARHVKPTQSHRQHAARSRVSHHASPSRTPREPESHAAQIRVTRHAN
jgi:hypothetical protein